MASLEDRVLAHFKGSVQRDFRPPVFFHHSNRSGPLTSDQWVKIFSFFVLFSPRYSNFSIEITDFAQNHTARSKKIILEDWCKN